MKRYLTFSLLAVAFVSMLSFSGCILDALNSLTQNIPITQEFNITSTVPPTSYSKSETIDLSNSSTYQRYQDKIQNISFLTAEFRTKSVNPPDLSGNVTITLKDGNGNLLFTYLLGNIKPSDYQNTPYQLKLNSAQIGFMNAYLATLSNRVFQATIQIDNISSSTLTYNLDAVIDIVFTMKTKL